MASSKSLSLKLLIQRGPRQGETLEFKSRSTVRIGRVVKGNNLTIKDSGISSKHLIIEFKPESGSWEIKDLDSSNGTILNSSQLKPFSPFVITNGDEIKIGEFTSIKFEILPIVEETNNRRITRSRKADVDLRTKFAEGSTSEIGVECPNRKKGHDLGENSRVGGLKVGTGTSMVEDIPKRPGRGRPKKEVVDPKLKRECDVMSMRNTRSSKRGEVELLGLEQVVLSRRTRSAKNAEGVMPISVNEESKGLDVDDRKQVVENNKTRGARGMKKKPSIRSVVDVIPEEKMNIHEKEVPRHQSGEYVEDDNTDEPILKGDVSEQEEGAPYLKGKNSAGAMDENTQQDNGLCGKESDATTLDDRRMEETEAAQDVVLEEIMNCEVLRKELLEPVVNSRQQPCENWMDDTTQQDFLDDKTNAQFFEGVVLDKDGGAQCVNEQHCAEEADQQDDSLVGVSHAEELVCNGVKSDVVLNDERMVESDIEEIVKESEVKCYGRSKDAEDVNVPNLEKMTLGEWFDYMEVYLPKQIYAATDEIIKDMQERAKQFDEFMLQQQKEKKT